MPINLTENAYSPRLLSLALNGVVKKGFIYDQIRQGKLVAQRLGGKNLIIYREDAEAWLANLPSALAPTNLGGSTAEEKRARARKRKTPSEMRAARRARQG
jgi:hypothetical protein